MFQLSFFVFSAMMDKYDAADVALILLDKMNIIQQKATEVLKDPHNIPRLVTPGKRGK